MQNQTSYTQILKDSFRHSGNNICLGIDPQWQKLPKKYRKTLSIEPQAQTQSKRNYPCFDTEAIREFLEISLCELLEQGLSPAAFKPNLGYFQALDRPMLALSGNAKDVTKHAFAGSQLLAWLHHFLSQNFPRIPIILDFKKGDISRSSANYAEEGFVLWGSDALTVSPYMGSDSISPFGKDLSEHLANTWPSETGSAENSENHSISTSAGASSLSCAIPYGNGGVYALLRTSNPGAQDLQNLSVHAGGSSQPLFCYFAKLLLDWREDLQIPGLGAVVGATSLGELQEIARIFSEREFPLLIPGVGKQGGSFPEVQKALREVAYPPELARVNLSSGLLQNWQGEAPQNWQQIIGQTMRTLLESYL